MIEESSFKVIPRPRFIAGFIPDENGDLTGFIGNTARLDIKMQRQIEEYFNNGNEDIREEILRMEEY